MKTIKTIISSRPLVIAFLILLYSNTVSSQVKVGDNPGTIDASAVLELESTEKGMLFPRMTTVQRTAISNPANGLIVFDTDLNEFVFFRSGEWSVMDSETKRSNYKLVQNAADLSEELTAGGGAFYLLDSTKYYEINGAVALSAPIDINGAYISGLDANEDKLITSGGTIFTGSKGGSIRSLTLVAANGTIFNLSGSGSETLVFQNCTVSGSGGTTDNLGSISNYNVVFLNIINIVNFDDGIVYSNINNLLLSNVAWFESNSGTFETYSGAFDLIQKKSGFCKVPSGATGIDVSSNPTVASGNLLKVPFSGAGTYINGYTTGTYSGYFFTKSWNVDCPGIKKESDGVANADFYYTGSLTTGFTQTMGSSPAEVEGTGTFSSNHLFRFISSNGGNRLTYDGERTREFQVTASLSARITNALGDFYAFLIYKNGAPVTESNAILYVDASNGNSQIQNISMNAIVELEPGDYIEVYANRLTGSGSDTMVIFSENLSIK
ncbi:MAG: cell wall anchor protein [Fluviicola sp.]